eukprot:TRINITY_DN11577_c0_g1_i2.p1 TRINITY_DN11577_c0_g1~~TRINITY_DN11577_c0_g1_i2.p1  ORF type:complete len:258 (+),score=26.37 TRINITY_DN11577_c0_g1_i2:435-1208(+)
MPGYKKARTEIQEYRYEPERGTEVIDTTSRKPRDQIIGVNQDIWDSKKGNVSSRSLQRSSALTMYRAFWRLIYKFPVETRGRLSSLLRKAFKDSRASTYNKRKQTKQLKLGRQILCIYIDLLTRKERLRTLHDPVARFLLFQAIEEEKRIDNLDLYPFTAHCDEVKAIKDIGFHKIYREPQPVGSPTFMQDQKALGRNVLRPHMTRRPMGNHLRQRHRALESPGHDLLLKNWMSRHRADMYRQKKSSEFYVLDYGHS